jgi:hypothetical protein
VLRQLGTECSPEAGVSGLPERARARVQKVGFFYDNLGVLVAYGVIPEGLAIGGFGVGMREAWEVLRPYLRREAVIRNLDYMVYFEDLVCRLAETTPEQVYRDLRLRRMDGQGRPVRRR